MVRFSLLLLLLLLFLVHGSGGGSGSSSSGRRIKDQADVIEGFRILYGTVHPSIRPTNQPIWGRGAGRVGGRAEGNRNDS